jgi:hypothetical protein
MWWDYGIFLCPAFFVFVFVFGDAEDGTQNLKQTNLLIHTPSFYNLFYLITWLKYFTILLYIILQ